MGWWSGVFAGVFEENGFKTWCFCGQDLVNRLVGLGSGRSFSVPVDYAGFSDLFLGRWLSRFESRWLNFPVLGVKELADERQRATRAMGRNGQQ